MCLRGLLYAAALGGVVALVSDIGFGDEITASRGHFVAWMLALGALTSCAKEILDFENAARGHVASLNEANTEVARLNLLNESLGEDKESLLRLMESYKSSAYVDIVDQLETFLHARISLSELEGARLQAERARIDSEASPNDVPADIKMTHRAIIIISGGKEQGVREGMSFHVVDPDTGATYAVLSATEVHASASECSVIGQYDNVFMSEILEKLNSDTSGTVALTSNRLIPLMPDGLSEMDADSARQLLSALQDVVPLPNQNES